MTSAAVPSVTDELDVVQSLVPLQAARIIEGGCGAARLARLFNGERGVHFARPMHVRLLRRAH